MSNKKQYFLKIFTLFTWILLVIFFIILVLKTKNIFFIPSKYLILSYFIIGLIIGYIGITIFKNNLIIKTKQKKINSDLKEKNSFSFTKEIILNIGNVLLSTIIICVFVFLPSLEKNINNIFSEQKDEPVMVEMNVYALSNEYKQQHKDIFKTPSTSYDITEYKNKKFLIQSSNDFSEQKEIIDLLNKELNVSNINTITKATLFKQLNSLYSNEGDVMIMNPAYEDIISDIPEYKNFKNDTEIIDTISVEKKNISSKTTSIGINDITSTPFTIYIAGSDTRNTELEKLTRTDVNMTITLNPNTYQVLIISYPRDSFIPNPAINNKLDKLTHLGLYGLDNSCLGISNYMGININKYMLVNFNSFETLIDAIGGIDIYNTDTYTSGNGYGTSGTQYSWKEGKYHLNGDMALAYARERYNLIDGDFGRNRHQMEIMKGIMKKLQSKYVFLNINKIMEQMNGVFLTNIEDSNIKKMINMELSETPDWNIVKYHIVGDSLNAETASFPGAELSCVKPYEYQIKFVKGELEKVMNGEVIKQYDIDKDINWDGTIKEDNK